LREANADKHIADPGNARVEQARIAEGLTEQDHDA
jgi:hypothetical protein